MTNKDQHPAILYKYIDTTGGLSMLQKEELWFRRTGFLNDPYDCYLSHECQGKYPEFSVSFDLNELTKYFGICSLSGKHGKIAPVGTDEIDPVKTA